MYCGWRPIQRVFRLKRRKRALIGREQTTGSAGGSDFSWEQRKVQDVADRFDNLRIPVAANLRVHGTTPYYGANGIQDYATAVLLFASICNFYLIAAVLIVGVGKIVSYCYF